MIAGATVAAVCALLPWVTAPGADVNGFERYFFGTNPDEAVWNNPGAYVLGVAVLAGLAGALAISSPKTGTTNALALLSGIGGFVVCGAAFAVARTVVARIDGDSGLVDTGIGAYGVAASAIVLLVGGITVAKTRP